MNTFSPVRTELGYLQGRDWIFLDEVIFRNGLNTLVLEGEINGNLCSVKAVGEDIPYQMVFRGVLALKMVELDSWVFESKSSFDRVLDSSWVKELGGKVNENHQHYLVQTYDEVFEVVCAKCEFYVKRIA